MNVPYIASFGRGEDIIIMHYVSRKFLVKVYDVPFRVEAGV